MDMITAKILPDNETRQDVGFTLENIRYELSCVADTVSLIHDALVDYSPFTPELNRIANALSFADKGLQRVYGRIEIITGFGDGKK